MNTKRSTALVIGMLLALTTFAEEAKPFEPDFSKMKDIIVTSRGRQRWVGQFWPSGGASLERSPADINHLAFAQAPAGSFSFEGIYALVAPHLTTAPTALSSECLTIYFRFEGDEENPFGTRFWIEDKEAIRTLMHGLRDKVFPRNHRAFFEEALSTYPLVPGDKPTPFKYSNKAVRIAEKHAREKTLRNTRDFIKMKRVEKGLTAASPEEEERIVDKEVVRWKIKSFFSDVKGLISILSRRPWLYVGSLGILCAGVAVWFIRKKK
jgi:hypothetical protein